ncbi:MAG TPA: four-helix bundle copper-binding protein [Anaeromyxobacter sp.]|nr:four-helix bundle copper-binding protein [Anaeromyxobacter sp.]
MTTVRTGSDGWTSHTGAMLHTHPGSPGIEEAPLLACIQACYDCAQSCTACADACLGEQDPRALARCIRLNLDCASLCEATGRILSRQTAFDPEMARAALQACEAACRLCAEECERHAPMHEHCRVCADACRACEQACQRILPATMHAALQ